MFLSAFLGVFGLSNLAPNSTVGQLTGQHISQQSQVNKTSKEKAPSQKQVKNDVQATRREPSSSGSGKKLKPQFKPVPQKHKKHTNRLKLKSKARRKRIRKGR